MSAANSGAVSIVQHSGDAEMKLCEAQKAFLNWITKGVITQSFYSTEHCGHIKSTYSATWLCPTTAAYFTSGSAAKQSCGSQSNIL